MSKNEDSPFFSVVIPVKQLTYYLIFESLPAFDKQIYKKFEVLVLPNVHSQYDLTLLRKYRWLKIIPTGKVTRPAQKRNLGVQNAQGDIVAFIDDDAYPAVDWLQNAKLAFKKKLSAVCGPGILPKNSTLWEKIFDEVLKTWIGGGNYRYRFVKAKKRFVDDYPSMNFLIYKKLFLKLHGFNGDYWPGEDSKLCEDVVYKESGKILYDPKVLVYHHRRKDLSEYLKQHASYGFHRGAFFAHGDKNSRHISYLVPTFFVFYLLFFILYSALNSIFKLQSSNLYHLSSIIYLPISFYILFELYLFIRSLFNTHSLKIALGSIFVLFLTHLVYGTMFVKGIIKGIFNKKNIYG